MSSHPATIDLASLAQATSPEGLLTGFELKTFPKGYLLSTPDGPRDQVFIVRSGRLRVYLAGENRELSLSFLEAGDIYTTHTPTYVESVAPTELWLMDTRSFARKLATDPSTTPVMMRVLGRLLSNAVTLIEDLAFREVPARLARFLLGLVERRGQPQEQGWLIPLELGMEDIASLLGSTRQTVSALINQWERQGILQRQGRRSLLIRSISALEAQCPPRS
ncbi:Crp/Fnr family transcriptional regulator [Azovibrio restrictus]|uniref:Crp/Fnr family transcriptional regulator n=1 Tax=Azovibrio restrictus TaxID=146938 RepID=UPI0026EA4732|nr:Crp/Fnr family transcriptional regulator [Azovibrio restrictus]MDD3482721.1 Crp/Fnr family transcriptional regulator [Azovibrio restrictus]